MKSPEQIADEAADTFNPSTHEEWEAVRTRVVQAIYQDRAQREQEVPFDTLDAMLAEWEDYDGEVDTFILEWSDKIKRTLNGE